jgi:glycosyl transferase family 2
MTEHARHVVCGVNCGLVVSQSNPPEPSPLETFRFFAVLGTWSEADVVAATVKNALTQGCERVYLLDNDSLDDTVRLAVDAGATLAGTYSTDHHDESLRTTLLNGLVARISLEEGADHIWWLYIDADEFPHGPQGTTLRHYLSGLDRQFRVVGSRVFNHYPAGTPHYVSGYHPLDFQPLCEEFAAPMCPAPHWKHPLQRYDRAGPYIVASMGHHTFMAAHSALLEPTTPIYTHHFQFRDEAVARRRLAWFSSQTAPGQSRASLTEAGLMRGRMHRRVHTLDAVYGQRWAEVERQLGSGPLLGVNLRPWSELVPDQDAKVARWYGVEDLTKAFRTTSAEEPS